MRPSLFLAAAAAVFLAACGNEVTSPNTPDGGSAVFLEGSSLGITGSIAGSLGVAGNIPELPANLALTADQRAKITSLVDAFQQATKAVHDALAAIDRKAGEAKRAGKTPAEIEAIRAEGAAIRARMEAAAAKLRADIDAVLTEAQRAWIKDHGRKEGGGAGPCEGQRLTAAQQAQIQGLIDAFTAAHKADIEAIQKAMEAARAAKKAGKSEAEINALLKAVADAQARLEAGHATLQAQITAVLTPAQVSSGCFTKGPGGR